MPKFDVEVRASALSEALGLAKLPDCDFEPTDFVEIEVDISQDEIDDEASDVEPEMIEVKGRDLREALRSLLAGDYPMARIMLQRALEGHEDAQRIVEEELRAAARAKAA